MAKRKRKTAPAPIAAAPRLDTHGRWTLRVAAVTLFALGVLPMANLVAPGTGLPWWPEAVKQWLVWGAIVGAVALLLARVAGAQMERLFERGERVILAPSTRWFALGVFAATMALSLYFGWRLFDWHPVTGDEFSQRFQALLLSSGRLSARTELHGEFFSTSETLDVNGRWFSQFPMGWPALLAVGVRLGVPWLINPVLAGLAAIAVYQFARAVCDELTARVTAILFALSPFVLFMAGSQMNHTATLAALWMSLAAVPRWLHADDDAQARRPAILIGLGIGVAATIRPFDAAVVALMVGVLQLRVALRKRELVKSIVVQCAIALIPVALVLAANRATTGAALPFAYDVLNGAEHRPGFHLTPLGFDHTPRRGLYNISAYLMKLDAGLLGWPVPAVLVVVAALLLMRRASTWDKLLLAILGGVLLGYFAYWSESYFVGPRFLMVVAPVFLFYIARFPGLLRERTSLPMLRTAAGLLVPLWIIIAWDAPAKDGRLYGVHEIARLYDTRGQPAPQIAAAVSRAGITNALIFIPDGWHARLTARLRALGMRPLFAEQIVSQEDACALQQYLDAADMLPANVSRDERISALVQGIGQGTQGQKLAFQPPSDQLSLVPGKPLTERCQYELSLANSLGVSIAELLPYETLDRDGSLTGVVFARDFGERNVRLVDRFGDKPWYIARITGEPRALKMRLDRLR